MLIEGKDKIGYIHPKPLDIKALFLESIFQAIHRIGTPFAGDSATLLLDKKIIDGNYFEFSHISLFDNAQVIFWNFI